MTMIESVAARHRGAYDFEAHYDNLCALQSSCPLVAVKSHLSDGVLDINGDRIRSTDWIPILNTLKINKTLKFVAIRSYYQHKIDEQRQQSENMKIRQKSPAIRSKEITYRLCRALRECMQSTNALQCIELQGLPLRERDLMSISKGMMKNSSMTHLSLEYCGIGDDGMNIICQGVKNSVSVTSLNFTGCSLSWKGAETLGKVIRHQAMRRHNEAWQDSLRYRRPDLDRMPGIRRISINCNPMLGDQGAQVLAEALKDDLWLKALDLQQCGMSSVGAKTLLEVLKFNTTIVVLDVRQNPMIDRETMQNIMEQVLINSNGQETEYKWVKVEPPQDPTAFKPKPRKRTKTLASSFGRKTVIKVNSSRKRSKTTGASHPMQPINAESVKAGPGMPWRTAQRANRYRGYPPEDTPGKPHLFDSQTSSPTMSPRHGETYTETADDTEGPSISESLPLPGFKDLKHVKVEFEQLRRRLKEETEARTKADKQVLEVQLENTRLRAELDELRRRGSNLLDDDGVLESIEASFQQFHSFLDLLKESGLGDIVKLAGLDNMQVPFAASTPMKPASSSNLNGTYVTPSVSATSAFRAPSGQISIVPPAENSIPTLPPEPKFIRPNLVPNNYMNAQDPTMKGEPPIEDQTSKFDELYEKVLRETEGALAQGDTGSTKMKTGVPLGRNEDVKMYPSSTRQKDITSEGDAIGIPVSYPASKQTIDDDENSIHSGSETGRHTARGEILQDIDALSIGSNRSKHSGASNRSKKSGGSAASKHSSRSKNETTGTTQIAAGKSESMKDDTKADSHDDHLYSEQFEKTASEISEDIDEILGSEPDDF